MLKILDCTLRDGGNVVGKGFDANLTSMMLKALIDCNVDYIEMATWRHWGLRSGWFHQGGNG